MLAVAALLSLWIQGRERSAPQVPGYLLVADLDTWQATPREREVVAAFDLRLGADWAQVPLSLGEWTGQDVPQDNLEVYLLLQLEQYLFRQYRRSDGTFLWLSLLGSREARSFHPPQICYTADGWRTEMRSERVALDQGEAPPEPSAGQPLLRAGQHLRREVHPHGPGMGVDARCLEQHIPGPGGHVQQGTARRERRFPQGCAAPSQVPPQGHQAVYAVVMPVDGREHAAHALRLVGVWVAGIGRGNGVSHRFLLGRARLRRGRWTRPPPH